MKKGDIGHGPAVALVVANMIGFLAGWVSLVAGFAAPIALAAMAFGRYLAKLGVPVEPIWLAGGAVVLVTVIMLGSTSAVGRFLGGLTILKVTLMVAFMVGAMMPAGGGEVVASVSLMPKAGDWDLILSGGFATSLVYVMYAYTGWNGRRMWRGSCGIRRGRCRWLCWGGRLW
jgi:APA family basic amino acid/polyamine antiporter